MISRRTFAFYSFRYFKTVFIIISNPRRSHFAGALFSFAKAADVEPLGPGNIVDRGVKRTAAEDLALDQRGALHNKGVESMFAQKGKARCLKARIWDDVSRVVSGKVTEIRVSLARSHLLRQFLLLLFSWCTVRVATRIGCQHTELVKDEKAEVLIMEGETRPGKRTASFDVF